MHLLPFLLRAQAVLRRHISAFLAGKSHPTLLRGWPGSTGYQIFVISSQSPPPALHPYLPLFVTIRHYSWLFVTSRLFALFVLFVTIRCSVFATIRYSGFPDTRCGLSSVEYHGWKGKKKGHSNWRKLLWRSASLTGKVCKSMMKCHVDFVITASKQSKMCSLGVLLLPRVSTYGDMRSGARR